MGQEAFELDVDSPVGGDESRERVPQPGPAVGAALGAGGNQVDQVVGKFQVLPEGALRSNDVLDQVEELAAVAVAIDPIPIEGADERQRENAQISLIAPSLAPIQRKEGEIQQASARPLRITVSPEERD